MVEDKPKPTWVRRLTTSTGIGDKPTSRDSAEITAAHFGTMLSLGTEKRVRLCVEGQDFIEVHLSSRGYIYVEVGGLEMYGVRVTVRGEKLETDVQKDKITVTCE